MTFRRAWFLFLVASFLAIVSAFFYSVNTAHSQPSAPIQEVEATAEDYERLCGLKEVECPNEKTVTVTAYTSRTSETDSTPCIGAYNNDICAMYAKGQKVCASNDYAKGTRLNVEGLGDCVVLDKMNRRYTGTGRVDWYFGKDLKAARAWGKKTVEITMLETK